MRATSFFSGLLLTTAVLAAPAPRPSDCDIASADPFNLCKRLDLPVKLPTKLPSTSSITGELDGAKEKLPVKVPEVPGLPLRRGLTGGLTDGLPVKVPSTAQVTDELDTVTSKVPVKLPTDGLVDEVKAPLKSLPVPVRRALPSLSADQLTKELEAAINGLGLPETGLPVRHRRQSLDSLDGGLTGKLTPVLDLVTGLLQEVIDSFGKADAAAKLLATKGASNLSDILHTLETDLYSGIDQFESALSTLEKEGSSAETQIKALVSKVQTSAAVLVADMEAVGSSVPGVDSLIATGKSFITKVQGLGL